MERRERDAYLDPYVREFLRLNPAEVWLQAWAGFEESGWCEARSIESPEEKAREFVRLVECGIRGMLRRAVNLHWERFQGGFDASSP